MSLACYPPRVPRRRLEPSGAMTSPQWTTQPTRAAVMRTSLEIPTRCDSGRATRGADLQLSAASQTQHNTTRGNATQRNTVHSNMTHIAYTRPARTQSADNQHRTAHKPTYRNAVLQSKRRATQRNKHNQRNTTRYNTTLLEIKRWSRSALFRCRLAPEAWCNFRTCTSATHSELI